MHEGQSGDGAASVQDVVATDRADVEIAQVGPTPADVGRPAHDLAARVGDDRLHPARGRDGHDLAGDDEGDPEVPVLVEAAAIGGSEVGALLRAGPGKGRLTQDRAIGLGRAQPAVTADATAHDVAAYGLAHVQV